LAGFGTNPGELDARDFLPLEAPSGMVVVHHACTQSAAVYDQGSGWSKLAEQHGFAVLFPQQRRANNSNLCFNWYLPGDARRGLGEASSISQMVKYLATRYRLDRSRIFITGLSAGGAMTSVMLACYPELFAGGSIIAGLPFASANSLPEALERMRGQGFPSGRDLSARAASASGHDGSPPVVSVWHGTHDRLVDPANASAIVDQWRHLHGIGNQPGRVEAISGHRRETWSDSQGRTLIEKYDIRGMGHGTPIDMREEDGCGTEGPHMLQVGICSTRQMAESWGLVSEAAPRREPSPVPIRNADRSRSRPRYTSAPMTSSVQTAIEDALRAGGLLR
jgi:poly(hydroxyalkanoate) depolymerase family esterase